MENNTDTFYFKNSAGAVHQVDASQWSVLKTQNGVTEITEDDFDAAVKLAKKASKDETTLAVSTSTDESYKALEAKHDSLMERVKTLEAQRAAKAGPVTPEAGNPGAAADPKATLTNTQEVSTTPAIKGAGDTNGKDGGGTRAR